MVKIDGKLSDEEATEIIRGVVNRLSGGSGGKKVLLQVDPVRSRFPHRLRMSVAGEVVAFLRFRDGLMACTVRRVRVQKKPYGCLVLCASYTPPLA